MPAPKQTDDKEAQRRSIDRWIGYRWGLIVHAPWVRWPLMSTSANTSSPRQCGAALGGDCPLRTALGGDALPALSP